MDREYLSNLQDVVFTGRELMADESPLSCDSLKKEASIKKVKVFMLHRVDKKIYYFQYQSDATTNDIGGDVLNCELPLSAAWRYLSEHTLNAYKCDKKTLSDNTIFFDAGDCRCYLLYVKFSKEVSEEEKNDTFSKYATDNVKGVEPGGDVKAISEKGFKEQMKLVKTLPPCIITKYTNKQSEKMFWIAGPFPESTYPQLGARQELFVQKWWKEKDRTKLLIEKFNTPITVGSLKNLQGTQWLDDQIMNFYCKMIQEMSDINEGALQLPRIWIENTYCYADLERRPFRTDKKRTNTRKWLQRMKTVKLVILPMHMRDNHWVCGWIDFKTKKKFVCDSYTDQQKLTEEELEEITSKMEKYLVSINVEFADKFEDCISVPCPQQGNQSDCGVFTLQCVLHLALGREGGTGYAFGQPDVQILRSRMAYEICTNALLPVPAAVEKKIGARISRSSYEKWKDKIKSTLPKPQVGDLFPYAKIAKDDFFEAFMEDFPFLLWSESSVATFSDSSAITDVMHRAIISQFYDTFRLKLSTKPGAFDKVRSNSTFKFLETFAIEGLSPQDLQKEAYFALGCARNGYLAIYNNKKNFWTFPFSEVGEGLEKILQCKNGLGKSSLKTIENALWPLLSASDGYSASCKDLKQWALQQSDTKKKIGVVAYNETERKFSVYDLDKWIQFNSSIIWPSDAIAPIVEKALFILDPTKPKPEVHKFVSKLTEGVMKYDMWQETFLKAYDTLQAILETGQDSGKLDLNFYLFPTFGDDESDQFDALSPRDVESPLFLNALDMWQNLVQKYAKQLRETDGAKTFVAKWEKFFDLEHPLFRAVREPVVSFFGVYTTLTITELVPSEDWWPDLKAIYNVLHGHQQDWANNTKQTKVNVYSTLQTEEFKDMIENFTTKKRAFYDTSSETDTMNAASKQCADLKLFWFLPVNSVRNDDLIDDFYEMGECFFIPMINLMDAVCDPYGTSRTISDLFCTSKSTEFEVWEEGTIVQYGRDITTIDKDGKLRTKFILDGGEHKFDTKGEFRRATYNQNFAGIMECVKPKQYEFDDIFGKCFNTDPNKQTFDVLQRRVIPIEGVDRLVQFNAEDLTQVEQTSYDLKDILIFNCGYKSNNPYVRAMHPGRNKFKIPFEGIVNGRKYYLKSIAMSGGSHWRAIVKRGGRWFHCNDTKVNKLEIPAGCTGFEAGKIYYTGKDTYMTDKSWVEDTVQYLFYEATNADSIGIPYGIRNEGNTCWSEAGVQCLFSLTSIWKKMSTASQVPKVYPAGLAMHTPAPEPPAKILAPNIVFGLSFQLRTTDAKYMAEWAAGLCVLSTKSAVHIRWNDNFAIATWNLNDSFVNDQLPLLMKEKPVLLLSTQFYFKSNFEISAGHASVIYLYKDYWVLYDPMGKPSTQPRRCDLLYAAITDMLRKKLGDENYYHNQKMQDKDAPFSIGVQKKMGADKQYAGFCHLLALTRILKHYENDINGDFERELITIATAAIKSNDEWIKNPDPKDKKRHVANIAKYCETLRDMRKAILPTAKGNTPEKKQGKCIKVAENILRIRKVAALDNVLNQEHRDFSSAEEDNRFTKVLHKKLMNEKTCFLRTRMKANFFKQFSDLNDWYGRMQIEFRNLNSVSNPVRTFRGTSHAIPGSNEKMIEMYDQSIQEEKEARDLLLKFFNLCPNALPLGTRVSQLVTETTELLRRCTLRQMNEIVYPVLKKLLFKRKAAQTIENVRKIAIPNLMDKTHTKIDIARLAINIKDRLERYSQTENLFYRYFLIVTGEPGESKEKLRQRFLAQNFKPEVIQGFHIESENSVSTNALTARRAPRVALLMLGIYGTDELSAQVLHDAADQVTDHGRPNLMFWGSAPVPRHGPSTMRIVKALASKEEHRDRQMETEWSVVNENGAEKVRLTFDDKRVDETGKVINNFWTWTDDIDTERASLFQAWKESEELQEQWYRSTRGTGASLVYDGNEGVWDSFIAQLADTGASFVDDHHLGGTTKHLYCIPI